MINILDYIDAQVIDRRHDPPPYRSVLWVAYYGADIIALHDPMCLTGKYHHDMTIDQFRLIVKAQNATLYKILTNKEEG